LARLLLFSGPGDAQVIKLLSERVPVLGFVNNHFAGYATNTIQKLLECLAATRAEKPSGMIVVSGDRQNRMNRAS
jgi:hypothetical protein